VAARKAQLRQLRRLLVENEERLLGALAADLGKPAIEGYAADIGFTVREISEILDHLDRWVKPRPVRVPMVARPGKAWIVPEPLGVTLVIAPWNYPIQLLLEPVAAALAAGNCVVAKPSELAPACATVMARHLHRYVDPDAVALVEGGVAETTALLENRFDHVFFTGSTAVGRVVAQAAAKHLTPVTLELGGKSPTIVAADADLAVAARRITWAKFMNAGQTCIAPDYVLVERSVRDELVERIQVAIREFYGADPRATADLGRVVNERHHDRLTGLVAGGGGTVVCGGDADKSARYLAPTIVVDPDLDSGLMTEEIFGPVLPIVSIDSVEDAIAFVNERPKPLALYIYSRSKEIADRVLARTSSGGACVNHSVMHILPETLPFGGVGPSGTGSYHGKAGFDTFSHHKSVLRKPTFPDPRLLYPPYSGWKAKLVRAVFR
jgi:aldehyde dehydrogenase (NAD+)